MIARPSSFARAIVARHVMRAGALPHLRRVFLHRARPARRVARGGAIAVWPSRPRTDVHLHVALRLAIAGASNALTAGHGRRVDPRPQEVVIVAPPHRVLLERTVERIATAARRHEHSAARPTRAFDAVPRVTKRAAPAVELSMTTRAPIPAAPRAVPAAPVSLDAREVARVTDAVIESMDRRMLSYRERRGRA